MEKKSLINICLDLVELDPEAEENKKYIQATLNQLGSKVENYISIYKFSDSQINMLKEEIEHLKKQVKSYERFKESLENRAHYALTALGERELKSDNGHKIMIRESESVEIEDLTKLPDRYVRKKIVYEADKVAIKYAIKGGEDVPGAFLKKNESVNFK